MGEVKTEAPIQVNNNCLQCSGNAMYIRKAFKMACLTYGSTKVNFENRKYERTELLDIRDTMLQNGNDIDIQGMLERFENQENNRKHISSTSTLKGLYSGGGRASLAQSQDENEEILKNDKSTSPLQNIPLHKPVIQSKPRPMTATNLPNMSENIERLPMSQTLEVKDFVS